MSQLSNSFVKTATNLVLRFGKEGYAVRQLIVHPSDPKTPTRPGYTEVVEHACKAAITSYEEAQVDGVQILRSDVQAVVVAEKELPEVEIGNEFVDTDNGKIIGKIIPPMQTLSVNGVSVVYILQIRGS